MNISRFFIDRPIFAAVLSIVIIICRAHSRCRSLPDRRVPRGRAADGRGRAATTPAPTPRSSPRRSPRRSRNRSTASRTCSTCPPRHHRRRAAADRDVRARHRRRHGAGAGAEPGQPGAAAAARGGAPASGVTAREELARSDHGRAPDLARRPLRRAVPAQLRAAPDPGRAGAAAEAWATCRCSAAATTPCGSGSIPPRSPRRNLTAGDVVAGDPRAERPGRRRRLVGRRSSQPVAVSADVNTQGRLHRRGGVRSRS